jgi:toxin ParE1/3/4
MDALEAYIAQARSPEIAAAYVDRIVARLERIALAPRGGSQRADLGPSFRSVPFERRVTIVYRLHRDTVIVSGIFYGGQDVARHYRKRDR